jgi:two-component system, OmpR family, aerobic respiration control sensor histidine kinase ArcB
MKKETGLPQWEDNKSTEQVIASIGSTYQNALEQELWAVKERADHAKQVEAAFMANMRHDIRTPLNNIVGIANILKDEIKNNKIIDHVDDILNAGHALLDFFNDILETMQVTSGQLPCVEKQFNLRSILESIIQFNLAKAHEKGLHLIFNYDAAIPPCLIGDPKRIYRIVLELVANALKFTAKGSVTVSAVMKQNREQDVIINICVEDTGIGIPTDEKEVIFEQFRRLTPSYEGNYSGVGLGLTIVKQFVADIKGEIYLESELQRGSAFTCVLSLKKATLESITPPIVQKINSSVSNPHDKNTDLSHNTFAQSSTDSLSILVVEDNPIAAKITEALLKNLHCHVDIAINGKSAIKCAKNHDYDLIIMDVGLPDISGIEVTRWIRAWEATCDKHTSIVALTAHYDTDNKQQCMEAGMDAVFSKPLLKERAMAILREFIRRN